MKTFINTSLASGMTILMVIPIFVSYSLALQSVKMPPSQSLLLKIYSAMITWLAVLFGCDLILNIIYEPLHKADLLTVFAAFFLFIFILRKGPDFFAKRFFNRK